MKDPFLALTQTDDGWQAIFAFQVFHRKGEEWMKMRWGFNAGVLLEEALDRQKLFIESQGASEAEFRSGVQPVRTLALRGINLPGQGLQMGLLGKTRAETRDEVERSALAYARELHSVFPHDFIAIPAAEQEDYQRLSGHNLLSSQTDVTQIQRGTAVLPSAHNHRFFGLWQASSRSNEQVWRALSAMRVPSIYSVILQPTFFYEGERKLLLEIRKQNSDAPQGNDLKSANMQWIENVIKRRLAAWRKFFLLQIHVIAERAVDENLLRSIGSSFTRDTNDLPLPGFQVHRPDSDAATAAWQQNILMLDLVPAARLEDLVDSDEAFAVFRFPYRPEAGLPGADFIAYKEDTPPVQSEQGQE